MKLALIAALALAAAIVAGPAPAAAQPVDPCPPAPDFSRHGPEREAIEYVRAIADAVGVREEAAALDRTADLAMLLLPDLVPDASADCHGPATMPALPAAACNAEARQALSAYLASAVPAAHIRDAWAFLVRRAGPIPPADAGVPIAGWRFTALTQGQLPLRYHQVAAPAHIDRRRARAWQYLTRHPSGEVVMAAVSRFVQSRLAGWQAADGICTPATAAAPD